MKKSPHHSHAHCCICCIVPPHILKELAQRGSDAQRERALRSLVHSANLRGQREILSALTIATPAGEKRRTIYDAQHYTNLPGKLVRGEGGGKSKDVEINEA